MSLISFDVVPFVIIIVIIMMNRVLYVSKNDELILNKKPYYIHIKEDL